VSTDSGSGCPEYPLAVVAAAQVRMVEVRIRAVSHGGDPWRIGTDGDLRAARDGLQALEHGHQFPAEAPQVYAVL
jgi:hypothetical protein